MKILVMQINTVFSKNGLLKILVYLIKFEGFQKIRNFAKHYKILHFNLKSNENSFQKIYF